MALTTTAAIKAAIPGGALEWHHGQARQGERGRAQRLQADEQARHILLGASKGCATRTSQCLQAEAVHVCARRQGSAETDLSRCPRLCNLEYQLASHCISVRFAAIHHWCRNNAPHCFGHNLNCSGIGCGEQAAVCFRLLVAECQGGPPQPTGTTLGF